MQEAARRYAEDARRRAGVPIHIRVGVNSGEVVVRSIGGDLKMDYTAVRRDCPRRLMSSWAGVADALEDLSGRGASGRPVSFTRSRACSVCGPIETAESTARIQASLSARPATIVKPAPQMGGARSLGARVCVHSPWIRVPLETATMLGSETA